MFLASLFLISLQAAGPSAESSFVETRGSKIRVDVVRTPEEWQKGLMFREKLGDFEGMLFFGNQEKLQSFWMKNTYIPLDIIYISKNFKIVHIAENNPILSEKPIPSMQPAQHVLEIKAGRARAMGIKEGDSVKFLLLQP